MSAGSKLVKAVNSLLGKGDDAKKAKKTNRETGGGKDETIAERIKSHARAATTEPTEGQEKIADVTKAQRVYKQGQNKAGAAGAVAGAMVGSATTASLLSSPKVEESWESKNVEPPQTKKEASAFEKAFSAAHNAGEETFEFNGKMYTTEVKKGRVAKADGGSMMVPPEGMPGMEVEINIEPEEEGMLPDEQMEEEYNAFVMEEALSPEEMSIVNQALDMHPELGPVLDNLVLAASEFRGNGEVEGPGDGTSDSIPARLSDGEFVFTKKAVDQIGVENLEKMMAEAENAAERSQMNVGGYVEDPTMTEKSMGVVQSANAQDEEIDKMMLSANRIPSLLNR